jgi:hypothetical protein
MSVLNLESYNMPVVIFITDATYSMVCTLSGKDLPREIVDEYMRFVWWGPKKFEILTDEDYEKKFPFSVDAGYVIFIPHGG